LQAKAFKAPLWSSTFPSGANLRVKYCGRYMDDLYLIHESKDYLQECLQTIVELCAKLKPAVNMNKTRIVKLSEGVDFLKGKYRLLPSGKVLRLQGRGDGGRPADGRRYKTAGRRSGR
jgi:hypothetical protein